MKSGSFGADKPLVGQTDVQLDLYTTGSWRNGRIYHFYLQSAAFKVLVSADLHSWLLVTPWEQLWQPLACIVHV